MATIAIPIRELSANVQFDAASAQKAFWEVVEEKRREAAIHILLRYLTNKLNRRMERLANSQRDLVEHLRKIPAEKMSAAEFTKVSDDLYRIVAMTESMVDDCYEMPPSCIDAWRANLEKVANLSSHLENFAESFRIAADDTCTALLADIAQKVTAREAISA
jgi:DNA-directed RNA polymerase subunit F